MSATESTPTYRAGDKVTFEGQPYTVTAVSPRGLLTISHDTMIGWAKMIGPKHSGLAPRTK